MPRNASPARVPPRQGTWRKFLPPTRNGGAPTGGVNMRQRKSGGLGHNTEGSA